MGSQRESVEDTLRKVDQAMARLQEIQWTICGGSISCGGVKLSPRSTRGYLRTSLRCKQESLRMKESELAITVDHHTSSHLGQHLERSSSLRRSSSNGEWRRWSMPALLIQQAVGEIMEASNSAKEAAYLLSDSTENKLIQFPNAAIANLNEKQMDEMHQEQGSQPKVKNILDETGRHDLKSGEQSGLQNCGSIKPENLGHNLKVISKDASNLKHNRKIEREQYSKKVKAESPKLGIKVKRQMSFRASGQASNQGGMENLCSSLSVSHCSSPDKLINDKTSVRMDVEQIRPTYKAWMSRSSSTKAIMFPNSAFVSSPSKNSLKIERPSTSMRRKSLPPLKDLTYSGISNYSPSHKENESMSCTTDSFPKLIKSSSFSDAYGFSASKLRRQSSVSSLLNKTLKRFHVIKASPLVASQSPSLHDAKAKSDTIPSLGKNGSLRVVSSSQMQGCSGTRHLMATCNQSANCEASFPLKQPFQSLVPLPKKRISGLKHPQPAPQGEDVAHKTDGNMEAKMRQGKTNPMPYEREERQTSSSVANDMNREEASWIRGHSLQSNLPTMAKHSRNEMKCQGVIQQCNNYHPSPKQRLLRPIAINDFGQHETKMHVSQVKENNQKTKLLRKENRENGTEDRAVNDRLMSSNRFLRKSWSFRRDSMRLTDDEKIINGKGRSPSLKSIKKWMSFNS